MGRKLGRLLKVKLTMKWREPCFSSSLSSQIHHSLSTFLALKKNKAIGSAQRRMSGSLPLQCQDTSIKSMLESVTSARNGGSWARNWIWTTTVTYSCSDDGILTYPMGAWPEVNPHLSSNLSCLSQILNPLRQSGNSPLCFLISIFSFSATD